MSVSYASGSDQPLGQKAANSAVFLGVTQVVRLVLTLLSTIVISRLLSPDDYGVMAMAAPVVGFIVLFQDLGLSSATIQAREMPSALSSGLFWINMLASVAIFLALLAAAPLVAWFYGDARAGYVTAASAFGLLIAGSSLQHMALLTREMRFATLSMIEVVNALVTFLAALAAAYFLRSYWALWIGTMSGMLVQVALAWRMMPWRPALRPSLDGTGRMARFGGSLTGFNILNFISRNIDYVLIAKFAGAAAVGLYDRSIKLMMLPLQTLNGPLGRLMLPVLSRLVDQPERYRRSFLLAIRAILFVATPGIAIATAISERLMVFLLGAQWAAAGPIFFWLGLASLLQPVSNTSGWLFISSGNARAMFHWGIVSMVTTVLGILIGLSGGVVGVAMGLFVALLVRTPILYAWCVRGTSVRSSDLYLVMVEPGIGAAAGVALLFLLPAQWSTGLLLLVALPAAYAATLAAHLLTPAGRALLTTGATLGAGVVRAAYARLGGRTATGGAG